MGFLSAHLRPKTQSTKHEACFIGYGDFGFRWQYIFQEKRTAVVRKEISRSRMGLVKLLGPRDCRGGFGGFGGGEGARDEPTNHRRGPFKPCKYRLSVEEN